MITIASSYDGSLIFDTKIDGKGFKAGIDKLKSTASASAKAVSAAVAGFGAYAVKVGSDFEASMSKVQAISGATAEDMELLTAKAKEMGASTKFSASESAEALQYMAMAGWKTEDMLGGLEGIMNLAAASGEDLALTSDIVTDALTAFGLKASDSGHFADVLAKASSNSNTNVAMMGETFKYVAPLAGSLGYSIEDTATAIGLMANAGIKGSEAGTALRAMLTRMVKPTDDVAQAMQQLGIHMTNADGTVRPFAEVTEDLRAAFAGLTAEQQTQYAATLAGQEAMSGMLAIVNASEADYQKLSAAIADSDGAAKAMAETMQDNLQGQITVMKSALEGLGITFYGSLETPLKEVVETGIDYINRLNNSLKNCGFQGFSSTWKQILGEMLETTAQQGPEMVESAANLLLDFLDGIEQNSDEIAAAGVQIVIALASAIIEVVPELADVGLQIMISLAKYIWNNLDQLGPVAVALIAKLATNLLLNKTKLLSAAGELVAKTASKLKADFLSKMPEVGRNIVTGIISGLKNGTSTLLNYIKSWAKNIISNVKGQFGIHSPSTVMRDEVGENLALGVGEGFDDKYRAVAAKMNSAIKNQVADLQWKLVGNRPAVASAAPAGGNAGNIAVTVYYNSTGSEDVDAKRLGRKIGQETDKELRARGIKK